MNLFGMLAVSGSALTAERQRAEVVTSNMANLETTRTPEGGPYRRQLVVFRARRMPQFPALLAGFSPVSARGVRVDQVIADAKPPIERYQPGHPDADAQGYVGYSTAQVDRKKVAALSSAIQTAFQQLGADPASAAPAPIREISDLKIAPAISVVPPIEQARDLTALRKELAQALVPEILRGDVALRNGRDGLVISLREAGFFDSGSAGVKAASQPAFSRIAKLLGDGQYNIRIEGHTDNVRIHNLQYSSNWELSTARSTEMIRLLVVKYGLDPQRLSASGYGQYHPIASNDTEAGRALNRRVDLVVLGKHEAQPAENQPRENLP